MLTPIIMAAMAAQPVPVVVELFTSEGCSSCPPADAALIKATRDQPVEGAQIIALSLHVDYWNNLGWADPFSQHPFAARQEDYGDGVYTPELVVDGKPSHGIVSSVKDAASQPKLKVDLKLEGSKVTVTLGDESKEPADVMLAVTEDNLISTPTRGENAGRTLPHAAVTRILQTVGEAKAKAQLTSTLDLSPKWKREGLKVIAFVQERKSRRIIGAAQLSLSNHS